MSAPARLRDIADGRSEAAEMLRAASRTRPLTAEDIARLRPRLASARTGLSAAKGGVIGVKGIASVVVFVIAAASSAYLAIRERSRRADAHARSAPARAAQTHAPAIALPPAATPVDTAVAPQAVSAAPPATPTPIVPTVTTAPASTPRHAHPVDSLAVEAAEIDDAFTLLATNPAAALAGVDRAALRHAHGQLASQREAIAVDSLFRLHRDAEAVARADALLSRHPDGLAAMRIRGLLRAHHVER